MNNSPKPKRIPANTNLSYWHDDTYNGYPLMVDKGPFIREYLERLYFTLQYALTDYGRVFAFRFDLRVPSDKKLSADVMTNRVIRRFMASFDAKIKHERERARTRNRSSHRTCVRHFWVREVGAKGRSHYHCIVFLNEDAYRSLGWLKSDDMNMHERLKSAWASALKLKVADMSGVVQIPKRATFHLNRSNHLVDYEFMHRSSYLCKSATKRYGDGQHGCGGSRC